MDMNITSSQVKRTPFFGSYVLETTGNGWKSEHPSEKNKRDIRLQKLFEMVDDYIEQA